jgi:hypothetical protein
MTALPPLSPQEMHLGADPALIRDELIYTIKGAIRNHPRSQQRTIGPSEMGSECLRKIGYRLSGLDPTQGSESWLPTVGTAVHAWLAEQFALRNMALGFTRYLIENRVSVGVVGGQEIRGTCDLYDRVTATVIDWKIVGTTTLRKAKSRTGDRLGRTYRTQGHLYGLGWERKGYLVQDIAVCFLPRNADLSEAVLVTERYDESIAQQAVVLADSTALALHAIGPDLLRHLPTANDYCLSCPWFAPYSTDPVLGCIGHDINVDPTAIAEGIILPD